MLPLSLSYDHRVIDGADGIRFLRWVVRGVRAAVSAVAGRLSTLQAGQAGQLAAGSVNSLPQSCPASPLMPDQLLTSCLLLRLVVIGAGPGGYAAAFYAADLGLQVALVDREAEPRRRLRLPRLHSVEGAAARRQAARRGAARRGLGRRLRRADDRSSTSCARSRTSVVKQLTERHRPAREGAQGAATSRGAADDRRARRTLDVATVGGRHRARARSSTRSSPTGSQPATVPGAHHRQPARDGLDRRARPAGRPEVAARRRRRLHRPRAGHASTPRSAAR